MALRIVIGIISFVAAAFVWCVYLIAKQGLRDARDFQPDIVPEPVGQDR